MGAVTEIEYTVSIVTDTPDLALWSPFGKAATLGALWLSIDVSSH
jgi:hypothetical protein